MKAKLKFDLNDPEERMQHMRCTKALDMAIALWDIQQLDLPEETAEKIGLIFHQQGIFIEDLIE